MPNETQLLERIALDPAIRSGKPTVRGTRLAVRDVLGYLAAGMSRDEVLAEFPELDAEDVAACCAYAARLMQGLSVADAA